MSVSDILTDKLLYIIANHVLGEIEKIWKSKYLIISKTSACKFVHYGKTHWLCFSFQILDPINFVSEYV